MKTISRPAIVDRNCTEALGAEMRSARWLYHRLLDFEDEHQRVLDETAEICAPGIVRVAALVARLIRRQKRRERTTKGQWSPNPHPGWLTALSVRLGECRKARNVDPRWAAATKWADDQVGAPKQVRRRRAKAAAAVKRRKDETDEAFAKRFELLTHDETEEHYAAKVAACPSQTRREAYRQALYDAHVAKDATERSCVYWGTWNSLIASVDQARKMVLKLRREGLPAEWRRPRWDDPITLAADKGFRVIDRGAATRVSKSGVAVGDPWWTLEMRLWDGWVRFRAKISNWHKLPGAKLRALKLTRRKDGHDWSYSVSIAVAGMPEDITHSVGFTSTTPEANGTPGRRELLDGQGVVALDWGHREHGHPNEHHGIRVFIWRGDDGQTGEILLPRECRELVDRVDEEKSRVDSVFMARKATLQLTERNRHAYRSRLMRSGVRSSEEVSWLQWETQNERRMTRARKRVDNLRRETYTRAIRELRMRYRVFALEDETIVGHRRSDIEEQTFHRKRQNRELSARYEFVQLCERLGAEILLVPARNSTRECPRCGQLHENGPELYRACPVTGLVDDKDQLACITILARAQEALAKRAT
jgi:hypothetical protein